MIVHGKVTKQELKAIDYFADALLSPQLKQHITITVSFRKTDNHWGLTIIDDYNKSGKPREFILEVKKDLSKKERLMTLAHEMVHVKQYAMMELNEQMNMWHGNYINSDVVPYMQQPWEIEAYDVGDNLFEEFIREFNLERT